MKATICGLVFLLLGTGFVFGQNPGGHIHQNHPTTDHQNGWHRISMEDGPTDPLVEPNTVETLVVLVDQDFVNQNCEPSTPSVSVTRAVGHSTEVGGSITLGGSVCLASKGFGIS